MTEPSSTAALNRALLAQLAREPDPHVSTAHPAWSAPAGRVAAEIREHLVSNHEVEAVAFAQLHRWRTDLDEVLDQLEHNDPAQYRRWCQPGTWLDGLLRLRSLLAHVLAKAYWNSSPTVAYADMEVARYLWGAR